MDHADSIGFRSHSEIYIPFAPTMFVGGKTNTWFVFLRACCLSKRGVGFKHQTSNASLPPAPYLHQLASLAIQIHICCFQQKTVSPSIKAYGHHSCWWVFWETCFLLAKHHKYQGIFQDLMPMLPSNWMSHLLYLQRQRSMEFCS